MTQAGVNLEMLLRALRPNPPTEPVFLTENDMDDGTQHGIRSAVINTVEDDMMLPITSKTATVVEIPYPKKESLPVETKLCISRLDTLDLKNYKEWKMSKEDVEIITELLKTFKTGIHSTKIKKYESKYVCKLCKERCLPKFSFATRKILKLHKSSNIHKHDGHLINRKVWACTLCGYENAAKAKTIRHCHKKHKSMEVAIILKKDK